jgi:membrane peptidoglycan carboxypeptidase
MIGSTDYFATPSGSYNVTTALRQPGSSIKPLFYLRGIERGLITAGTQLADSPLDIGGWKPQNYDSKFRGSVTVRRALSNSLNIPAVEVIQKVGLEDGISYTRTLGLKSLGEPSNYGPSLVLGGGEVEPIEMAAAYATLANTGIYNQPYAIEKIVDKYGQTIYHHEHEPVRVADENAVYIITNILSDTRARQEIFGGALDLPTKRPAAVKTGTTDRYKDAWTIGYTPSLAVAVWVGNNDNREMDSVAGSLGAAPIWKTIIEGALKNTPFEEFKQPSGVVNGEQCQLVQRTVMDNGQPKTFYEFVYAKEYFIKNTKVSTNCDAVRKQVEELQQGRGLTDPSVLQPAVAGDVTSTPASAAPEPTKSPSEINTNTRRTENTQPNYMSVSDGGIDLSTVAKFFNGGNQPSRNKRGRD